MAYLVIDLITTCYDCGLHFTGIINLFGFMMENLKTCRDEFITFL